MQTENMGVWCTKMEKQEEVTQSDPDDESQS